MMVRLLFITLLVPVFAAAQTNILVTNPVAGQIMQGNYDPADYAAATVITDPATIAAEINSRISADSLKSYIIRISKFGNRNSGADTLSQSTGIGAARRWVYQMFEAFSAQNDNRLLVSYLQFDQVICSVGRHRNIMAILPGSDPSSNGVILVEGHLDSRCAGVCDTACVAEGVEDNASGTALVLEAARVMSKYTFKNTIVFMVTTGEEQNLHGARAFAVYAQNNNLPLRAVFNNDVIGGIICGKTSSAPSCPGLNDIDSTSVRLFSYGGFNSRHKQLARFIKLEYKENLLSQVAVPMNVRIMSPEDRTNRGGDHIPFRELSFAAMRFTAANEHGNASNLPGYTDRQHTSDDVLGVDTDNDGTVDSFFVDFNYLARNTVINANALSITARGVPVPADFSGMRNGNQLTVTITDPANTGVYRVALRSTTNDWDTVFTLTGATEGVFPCNPTAALFLSVAGVDAQDAESLFTGEKIISPSVATGEPGSEQEQNIRLLQNRPNPFDEATWISFWVTEVPACQKAEVQITDLQGKIIQHIPVSLHQGLNETLYTHGYGVTGTFTYSLIIDGRPADTKQMIFAN